eukprot:4173994-Prorocentrum_lima.AAC.1
MSHIAACTRSQNIITHTSTLRVSVRTTKAGRYRQQCELLNTTHGSTLSFSGPRRSAVDARAGPDMQATPQPHYGTTALRAPTVKLPTRKQTIASSASPSPVAAAPFTLEEPASHEPRHECDTRCARAGRKV